MTAAMLPPSAVNEAVQPRWRSSSVVARSTPIYLPRTGAISWSPSRSRRRRRTIASLGHSAALFPTPTPTSIFSRLPIELVWIIISAASRCSTPEAQAVSLVCKHARRVALPSLFSVQALRSVYGVQGFLARTGTAGPLTPIGALVTSLWLTSTASWPAEAVRAVVRACPNVERLALTNVLALAPWEAAFDARPLFGDAPRGRPLALTLVGHNTAEDVRALMRHDPASAAAMAQRLTAVRILKLRSVFPSRSTDTTTTPPGTVVDADEGVVAALLKFCTRIEVLSIPYGQVASTMQDPGLESCVAQELDLLAEWIKQVGLGRTTTVELLVETGGLKEVVASKRFENKRLAFTQQLRVVDWPRNADVARERWVSES
jgi:hypothetical protein